MIPLHDMLSSALSFAGASRDPHYRRAKWARVAACLYSELPASETTTAAVLSAAARCIDAPVVVRVLVSAIWCVHGDDARVAAWTLKLVERACAEGHVRTVVTLVDLLTCMAGFDGVLSAETVAALLAAASDRRCHANLYHLAWQYEHRFGHAGSPAWARQLLDDPLVDGADRPPRTTFRVCPACRVTPVWAAGLMARAEARGGRTYRGG